MPVLEEKQRELHSPGTHTGILYRIVDLGSHKNSFGNIQRLVDFTWELPEEKMVDGRPFSQSTRYNFSLTDKSRIVKDIKSWTGEAPQDGWDPGIMLGQACNLTTNHDVAKNGKTYSNVSAIAPLKKGEKAPAQTNPSVYFDLDNFNAAVFESLPEFFKEMIKQSPEYQKLFTAAVNRPMEEVPFA